MATKRAAINLVALLPRSQTPIFRSRQFLQSASRTGSIPTTIRQKHTIPQPRFKSTNTSDPVASTEDSPSKPEQAAQALSPASSHPSSSSSSSAAAEGRINPAPHYEIVFTCKPCGERSRHKISKQGYHHGSILISCPGCRNRHVISDHLRIFGDRAVTVEELLKERGQLVKKGTLGEDGDLEFWEDGTVTERTKDNAEMLAKVAEEKGDGVSGAGDESWRESAPGASFKKD